MTEKLGSSTDRDISAATMVDLETVTGGLMVKIAKTV